MATRTVTNQAELDKAIADKVDLISINSPAGIWLSITDLKSSRAVLRGSSRAVLWESSRAELWESSRAELWGSSRAVLWESSSAHAYRNAKVTAAPLCAVFLHDSTVDVSGGVVLDHTGVKDMDGPAWCAYHGVKVSRGIATLYKAVNDKWTTDRNTDYSPGSKPSCDDFSDIDCCGGGLHFGPTPRHARTYFTSATKFLAVGVRVSELRPITGDTAKAKAPRVVRACVEVDIDGKEVA